MSDLAAPPSQPNLILRLLNGSLPLWVCYWIFGVVGSLLLRLVTGVLIYWLRSFLPHSRGYPVNLLYLWIALTIIYSIVVMIGTWRSAESYVTRKPDRKLYARLAQAGVILGAISLAFGVVMAFAEDKPLAQSQTTSAEEERQIKIMLDKMNAGLPHPVTPGSDTMVTRYDIKGNDYLFYYTIEDNISDGAATLATIKPKTVAGLCNAPGAIPALNLGKTFNYVYIDATGKSLGTIRVSKADCAP